MWNIFNLKARPCLNLVWILVLAAILRLIHLTRESAWLDEIFSIQFVAGRCMWQVVVDSFCIDFHPFSYYGLLDIFVGLFGCSDFASRLLSVILGVGAVFSSYLATKTVFREERAALLCALILSISPTHIMYSQEVRMYVLLLFVWPLFLMYLYKSWCNNFSGSSSFLLLITFAVFSYSHGTSGLLGLPVLLCFTGLFTVKALLSHRRFHAFRSFVTGAIGALIYLPWLSRLITLNSSEKALGRLSIDTCCELFHWLIFNKSFSEAGNPLLHIFAAVFLIAFLFRIQPLFSRLIVPIVPLLASMFVVLAVQWVLSWMKPCYQERNLVFLLPSVVALISYLAVKLIDFSRKPEACRFARFPARWVVVFFLALVVIRMALATGRQIQLGYGKEQWKEVVSAISPEIKKGDTLVFYADFMQQCWDHYAAGYPCGKIHNRIFNPPYHAMGIPRTDTPIFLECVQDAINAAHQLESPRNSLWVFYSHVRDPDRVHALLVNGGLVEISEWKGRGLFTKRYARSNIERP